MKSTAETYLGEEVKNAVVTVPAYCNDISVELRRWVCIVSKKVYCCWHGHNLTHLPSLIYHLSYTLGCRYNFWLECRSQHQRTYRCRRCIRNGEVWRRKEHSCVWSGWRNVWRELAISACSLSATSNWRFILAVRRCATMRWIAASVIRDEFGPAWFAWL